MRVVSAALALLVVTAEPPAPSVLPSGAALGFSLDTTAAGTAWQAPPEGCDATFYIEGAGGGPGEADAELPA